MDINNVEDFIKSTKRIYMSSVLSKNSFIDFTIQRLADGNDSFQLTIIIDYKYSLKNVNSKTLISIIQRLKKIAEVKGESFNPDDCIVFGIREKCDCC